MKKRIFSLLLIAAMVLSLLPAVSMWADEPYYGETYYYLWIAGVQVTGSNKNDILGNGVFSYDPSAKKLTVSGDYTSGVEATMIDNDISGLTIYVAEDSTLTTEINSVIVTKSKKDLTITGPGKLTLRSMNESAYGAVFAYSEATVTIADAYVDASGYYAIAGAGGNTTEYLVIRNSYVHAVGYVWSAICNFKGGITLTDCGIFEPTGGLIDNENGRITKANGYTAKEVVIGQTYDLRIAGARVTAANKGDILGNGVFSYDPSAKKLTVSGNYTSNVDDYVIQNDISGLTVYVAADSTLTNNKTVIQTSTNKNLTITGPGKLTMRSESQGVVFANAGAVVTVADAYVDASGTYGFAGASGNSTVRLSVRNSYLRVKSTGSGYSAIAGFNGGITLSGCGILEPAEGLINGGTITTKNGGRAQEVLIGRTYNLKVAGTQVTDKNAADILGNGAFAYDADANKLIIKKSYSYSSDNLIYNQIEGLTVYTEKDVELRSNNTVIRTYGDTTITGPGYLKLVASGGVDNGIGILVCAGKDLTIELAQVDVKGGYGIAPANAGSVLTVRHSYVHAYATNTGTNNGAIIRFDDIVLDHCKVTTPSYGFVRDGSILEASGISCAKDVILLSSYDFKVVNVAVTVLNASDILGDGSFSYDPMSSTLYVNKSYYDTGSATIIDNKMPGLTVCYNNSVTLSADCVMVIRADTTITAATPYKKLTISGVTGVFVTDGAALTIDGAWIEASCGNAFMGLSGGEKLHVVNSTVHAAASDTAAVFNFAETTFEGCSIVSPDGAKVRGGSTKIAGDIVQESGSYAKDVTIEVKKYNIWIAGRQVTAANRNDVYGDGTVKLYEKGEYTPTALDEKYDFGGTTFKYNYVLVLDNYKSTFPSFYENGDKSAQLYIDEDVYVVLKGENALYKGTWWDMEYNDMICHGIYTGEDSIHFMGDGSLVAYADFCEKEGLYGESTSLYISEEAKVTLYGKYGMYQKFVGDTPWLTVEDNAVLTCHGMGTDDVDYPGLYCAEVEVRNHGELICTTTGLRREAMSTWGSSFSCDYYDIKILKTDESGSTPFAPEGGINVTGGVKEGNCRYIDIKGKTTYVTGIRFSYDTYKLTPEKSSVTVWAQLLPSGAPELYNDLTWTTSDASVATVQKTGKTGCVITAVGNGTAIITATAPGGATGSVTVTVEGFTAASQRIDEVNIVSSFLVPTAGETVDGYLALSVPDGMPYTLNEVKWYRSGNEYPLEATDVFEEEIFYYIMLNVAPAAGYYFDKSHKPTALLNGLESNVDGIYTSVEQDGTLTFFSVDAEPVKRTLV